MIVFVLILWRRNRYLFKEQVMRLLRTRPCNLEADGSSSRSGPVAPIKSLDLNLGRSRDQVTQLLENIQRGAAEQNVGCSE